MEENSWVLKSLIGSLSYRGVELHQLPSALLSNTVWVIVPSVSANGVIEAHQGRLPGQWDLRGVLYLTERSALAILKFLILFEQGAPHIHFILGPTNDAASSPCAYRLPLAGPHPPHL